MRINKNLKLVIFDGEEGKLLFRPFGYHKLLMAVFGFFLNGMPGAILGLVVGLGFDMQYLHVHKPPKATDVRLNYLMLGAFLIQAGELRYKLAASTIRERLVTQFGEAYVGKRFLFFNELLTQRIPIEAICDHLRKTISEEEKTKIITFLYALTVHSNADYNKIHSAIFYIAGRLDLDTNVVKQIALQFTQRKNTQQQYSYSNTSQYKSTASPKNERYAIFTLAENCSYIELKKAYHRLAKQYHPDSHPQATVQEQKRMQEKLKTVIAAYEAIKEERGWR